MHIRDWLSVSLTEEVTVVQHTEQKARVKLFDGFTHKSVVLKRSAFMFSSSKQLLSVPDMLLDAPGALSRQ